MIRLDLKKVTEDEKFKSLKLSVNKIGEKVRVLSSKKYSAKSIYNYSNETQPSLEMLGYIQMAIEELTGEQVSIDDITRIQPYVKLDSVSVPEKMLQETFADYPDAISAYEQKYEDSNDSFEKASYLYLSGTAKMYHGNTKDALQDLLNSEKLLEPVDREMSEQGFLLVGCKGQQAECYRLRGEYGKALHTIKDTLNITSAWMHHLRSRQAHYRTMDDNLVKVHQIEGRLLRIYGDISRCRGFLAQAQDYLERAIVQAGKGMDSKGIIEANNILADLHCDHSNFDEAEQHIHDAKKGLNAVTDFRLKANNLLTLSRISRRKAYEAKFAKNTDLHRYIIDQTKIIDTTQSSYSIPLVKEKILDTRHLTVEAKKYLEEAIEILKVIQHQSGIAHCEYGIAKLDKYEDENTFEELLIVKEKFEELQELRLLAYCYLALGDVVLRRPKEDLIEFWSKINTNSVSKSSLSFTVDLALCFFEMAEAIFSRTDIEDKDERKRNQDNRGASLIALRIGQIHRDRGQLGDAKVYFKRSINPVEDFEDEEKFIGLPLLSHISVIARASRGLGTVYENTLNKGEIDYRNASKQYRQGLQIGQLLNQKQTRAFAYLSLGHVAVLQALNSEEENIKITRFTQAESYLSFVEDLLEKSVEDSRIEGFLHFFRAKLYRYAYKEETAPVLNDLDLAVKAFGKTFEYRRLGAAHNLYADVYLNLKGNPEKALEHSMQAIEEFRKVPNYIGLGYASIGLFQANHTIGQAEAADFHHTEAKKYFQKVRNEVGLAAVDVAYKKLIQ